MATIKKHFNNRILFSTLVSLTAAICILTMLSNAQQPVLKISDLGSNQFSVLVTNGLSTTNYTLFWTPALNDPGYPWVVLTNSAVGESNFMVDAGGWPSGFFKVLLGNDADGDGISEWLDAQPQNPSVGILSVTIDSPTNGMVFQ